MNPKNIEIELDIISEFFMKRGKIVKCLRKGFSGVKISVDQALDLRLDKLQA